MDETIVCPGCQAQLLLPALSDGQTVQCPRCQRVFEPARQRGNPAPVRAVAARQVDVEDEHPAELPRLGKVEPLTGAWKAYVAMAFLAASVLSYAVQVYVHFETSRLARMENKLNAQRPRARPIVFKLDQGQMEVLARIAEIEQQIFDMERFAERANFFHQVTYWPALVFFLIWLYHASRNLRMLQVEGLSHTPGQAVVSFFIPGMNLFVPYMVIQQIWRASHPRAVEKPLSWVETPFALSVRFWWFFYLGAVVLGVLSYLVTPSDRRNVGDSESGALIACAANLCSVIAGLLLIFIIHRITARQRERYIRLYEDPS